MSLLTRLRRAISPKKSAHSTAPIAVLASSEREFERVFHHFDSDGDGKISPLELYNCMQASGEDQLSMEDAEDVVRSTDTDGDGLLAMEDFLRLVGGEEDDKGRSLRAAFGAYEMEGRGCITAKSLKRALRRLGEPRTTGECREMIRRFDLDGDGVISFDEFKAMMVVG